MEIKQKTFLNLNIGIDLENILTKYNYAGSVILFELDVPDRSEFIEFRNAKFFGIDRFLDFELFRELNHHLVTRNREWKN